MMSGLESILQTAIKASRRLPSDKTILPEETVTETSEYQLLDAIPPQIYSESAELRGRRRVAHVKGIVAAAPGDIEEIWATYVQLFNLEVASHEQLQTVLNSEDGAQDAWLELADLGVEKFAQHNEQTLSRLLNFPGARPMLFAQFRSASGLCAWDADKSKRFFLENPDMKPLHLLWHQLVGISSVIEKTFTAEPVERLPPGVLIADAVGVGKTALTMGVIAFIIDAFYVQEGMAGRGVAGKAIESSATETRLAPIISCHLVSTPAHHANTPDREHPPLCRTRHHVRPSSRHRHWKLVGSPMDQ